MIQFRVKDTFLREALKGDYANDSENRLSQIFSACFNHSEVFRHNVSEFLRCDLPRSAESKTQRSYPSPTGVALIDVLLLAKDGRPLVVIENKTKADFSPNQLPKYSSIAAIADCEKFCFLERYLTVSASEDGWKIKYWRDLYLHILRQKRNQQDFASNNFISILEDYGMDSPLLIKQSNLKQLSDAFHKLRTDKPHFPIDGDVFETMVDLKKMLEDSFRRAAKDIEIRDKVGYAFRPKMYCSHWWEEKKKGRQRLLMSCEATLKKPEKGVKSLCAALLLYDKAERGHDLVALVTGEDGNWIEPMYKWKKKTDVDCQQFGDDAMTYWKSKLRNLRSE